MCYDVMMMCDDVLQNVKNTHLNLLDMRCVMAGKNKQAPDGTEDERGRQFNTPNLSENPTWRWSETAEGCVSSGKNSRGRI